MTFVDDFGRYDSDAPAITADLTGRWSGSASRRDLKSGFELPPARTHRCAALGVSSRRREVPKQFRRKTSLTLKQEEILTIQTGFVRALTWDEQGCVLTLGIWGPGESVALPLGDIAPYQLLCITSVRAQRIQLKGDYPRAFLLNQARQSQELLSLFRCRCVENRLVDALWWLASRFGSKTKLGRCTGIPLTHQELADLAGSTRVTITRMLRQLEEMGVLERLPERQLLLKRRPELLSAMRTR